MNIQEIIAHSISYTKFEELFGEDTRVLLKKDEEQEISKGKLLKSIVKKIKNFYLVHSKIQYKEGMSKEEIRQEIVKLRTQKQAIKQHNENVQHKNDEKLDEIAQKISGYEQQSSDLGNNSFGKNEIQQKIQDLKLKEQKLEQRIESKEKRQQGKLDELDKVIDKYENDFEDLVEMNDSAREIQAEIERGLRENSNANVSSLGNVAAPIGEAMASAPSVEDPIPVMVAQIDDALAKSVASITENEDSQITKPVTEFPTAENQNISNGQTQEIQGQPSVEKVEQVEGKKEIDTYYAMIDVVVDFLRRTGTMMEQYELASQEIKRMKSEIEQLREENAVLRNDNLQLKSKVDVYEEGISSLKKSQNDPVNAQIENSIVESTQPNLEEMLSQGEVDPWNLHGFGR